MSADVGRSMDKLRVNILVRGFVHQRSSNISEWNLIARVIHFLSSLILIFSNKWRSRKVFGLWESLNSKTKTLKRSPLAYVFQWCDFQGQEGQFKFSSWSLGDRKEKELAGNKSEYRFFLFFTVSQTFCTSSSFKQLRQKQNGNQNSHLSSWGSRRCAEHSCSAKVPRWRPGKLLKRKTEDQKEWNL